MSNIVIIGATGDVGQGITASALAAGHHVVAVGRNADKLGALKSAHNNIGTLSVMAGSLETEKSAEALRDKIASSIPQIDAVLISINSARQWRTTHEMNSDELMDVIRGDVASHFIGAKTFIPAISDGGSYIGIGGGSGDFVLHNGGHMSASQAALRMLYRSLAYEFTAGNVHLHELIIASVVNAHSTREVARSEWVTDREIGSLLMDMIATPDAYTDPIWRIARRGDDGKPVISSEGPSIIQGATT